MIWNYLCERIASCKTANQKEKDFENNIELFFQAYLNWKDLNGDIQKQVKIDVAHTKVYADIILFWDNKEEIIIELKKPNNIQVNDNVRQLTDYMKQKRCNFGLYIGEKLELYYDDEDRRKDPVLVLSIAFEKNNPDGIELMSLLNRNSYSPQKLEEYCNTKIKLSQVAKYWSSEEGINKIHQYILSSSQLPEHLVNKLAKFLSINVYLNVDNITKTINTEKSSSTKNKTTPEKKHRTADYTKYSLDGKSFVGKNRFVLEIIKAIIKTNPNITFQELQTILPKRTSNNYETILRKSDWLNKYSNDHRRYCTKEGELLYDVDGVEFYVSTQWTKKDIDEKILPIAQKYNLKVHEK